MSTLQSKIHYMQVALNANPAEAKRVIDTLPVSERILIEAGTPLIKEYGATVITQLKSEWKRRIRQAGQTFAPYIVADLKCMDRGEREVDIAKQAGAMGVVVLGSAPIATINTFIARCQADEIDAFVDMMNVDKPYQVLRRLPHLPKVVVLHRGVDEATLNTAPLPIHMINKVKGAFNVLVAIAGGDTPREIQSAVFNGADIVVLWKHFYQASTDTAQIAEHFLRTIK